MFFSTKIDLISLFEDLGLGKGMDVFVHSSMSSLGYLTNGAIDVIDALLETVDPADGNILMPAHTGHLTDPANWKNPPVPEKIIKLIRSSMLPFNPNMTPVRNRGIIANTFLTYPSVARSMHPLNSVSAIGSRSSYYTEKHSFHEPEGLESPIGRLYRNDGYCLLIGVGLESCTAIHLAEYIANVEYLYYDNPVVLKERKNNINNFVELKKYPGSSKFFVKLEKESFYKELANTVDYHGSLMTFFKISEIVDFAVNKLLVDPEFLIKE